MATWIFLLPAVCSFLSAAQFFFGDKHSKPLGHVWLHIGLLYLLIWLIHMKMD